jgi:hypothetical protein
MLMRQVCCKFAPLRLPWFSRACLCLLLRIPTLCQLLNVVHHAVQIPLRVDLLAPTVVKAAQSLVVPNVGKHRLHSTNALAVKLPASG